MDLFNDNIGINLLPKDGVVIYHGKIISDAEADAYYDYMMKDIPWKNDEAVIFGKHFITKRKVAWFGDLNYSYTYSGTTRNANSWTKELLELKKIVEDISGSKFNSCLLNLYHNGDEGMAWHSDDEKSLGKDTTIASLTFGAERKFSFKHKFENAKVSVELESGSLLLMQGTTQTNWLHSLPKTKSVSKPRVNLTFRTMIGQK